MERKQLLLAIALIVGVGALLLSVLLLVPSVRREGDIIPDIAQKTPKLFTGKSGTEMFSKFASEEEFRKYLEESRAVEFFGGFGVERMRVMTFESSLSAMDAKTSDSSMSGVATEYSTTNVQVSGIDEPDIIKTDGKYIYFSREPRYGWIEPMPFRMDDVAPGSASKMIAPRYESNKETLLLGALPPDAMKKLGIIDQSGEMLLLGDTLVVFDTSRRAIAAYDISDRSNPKQLWDSAIRDNGEFVTARSYDGMLYLVEKTWVDAAKPCPVSPLSVAGREIAISCTDIYHPAVSSFADALFTILAVDPISGEIRSRVSFVGSAGQSVVYMSGEAIYVTSPRVSDPIRYLLGFFKENNSLFPSETLERLEKLAEYELSASAKMTEFSTILERVFLGMSGDDRLKFENEMANRMADYEKRHLREFEFTSIAKVSVPKLEVVAGGLVPGHLLNQFSLDEYEGNLRVATTVGGRGSFGMWGMIGRGGNVISVNDVYVLDDKLRKKGELLDLGQGERIYSTRFVGKTGYLVTFRETDPFYVLDLSDPKEPRKAGELKIPGYSSYLHPLEGDLVLGIGKEDQNVKLSLFDVSDPDNPREVSKYILDEYWSEAIENHHAFLADSRHKVFFLPGGQGGYVFSYAGNTLSLEKAAKDDTIKRALYIGDTFYIVSETALYAYDSATWEKVGELTF